MLLRQTLDFSAAAKNYLHKSLLKFKAIAESSDLPKAVSKPPAPMPNAATANVIARLCNSNPVKEAMPSVLKEIQQALGVKVSEDTLKGKKRLRAKDFEEAQKSTKGSKISKKSEEASDMSHDESGDEAGLKSVMQRRPHSDNEDNISDEEDAADHDDPGADYDSEDFAKFESRIAASSDEEDDDESENESLQKGRTARKANFDISPSVSPEPERRSKRTEKPTKSAFIPSLTMGGYWSGSESEPEEDVDVAPRKNRRGQRARQAIAEKKFGKSAKHLQKQAAAGKNDRNQGWDPKRGATDGSGPRGRGGPPRFGKGASRKDDDRQASKPPPKKHRDDSGPLHPSWEAAKRAKEAKVTASFQGKKVTFD